MVILKQSDKWPLLFFVMMIIFLNSEICLSKAPVLPATSRDMKSSQSASSARNAYGSSSSSGQSCSKGFIWDGRSCKSKSLVCAVESQKNNNPACASSAPTKTNDTSSDEDSSSSENNANNNESGNSSCAHVASGVSVSSAEICEQCGFSGQVDENGMVTCEDKKFSGDVVDPTTSAGGPVVVDDCEEKATTAKSSCNFEGDSLSSEISKYVGVTTQALNASGASVTQACGEIGKLSQGANATMFAFQENCNRDQSACVQSCQKVRQQGANGSLSVEAIQSAGKNLQDCQNLAANIQKSQQYLMSLMQTTRSAQNCGQQSGDDFCKLYPTVGTCQTKLVSDCSNPTYAAANKICACATSGPGSLACLQAQASSQKLTTDPGSLTAAAAKGGGPGLDLSSEETNQGPIDLSGNNGPAEDIGGNKGGRSANGGSVGGGGGYAGGGGGGSGERQGLLGGFFGGNSSIGGFASAVGGAINKLIGREESSKKDKGPDLRQFLPGGKFDPKIRGLAGATGPDGITGPHTNIWKKINNRYQSQKVSLLP